MEELIDRRADTSRRSFRGLEALAMSEGILYGAGAHVFVRIRISHLYILNCVAFD